MKSQTQTATLQPLELRMQQLESQLAEWGCELILTRSVLAERMEGGKEAFNEAYKKEAVALFPQPQSVVAESQI